MHMIKNKLVGLMMSICLVLFLGLPSLASEYPTRPISVIVPYVAGGSVDAIARPLANAAKKYLGHPIIVEDKPGGAGIVGTKLVITKPPDGYTIGITSLYPILISYHMEKLDFHPVNDLTYIMRLSGFLFGVAVRADSPWNTIQEFIQYARANPQKISYATAGVGSTGHINMEELASLAGIQLIHVPYRSGAESNTALLGGHVEALSDATWHPFVDAGKFRLLLIYGNQRSPRYPRVPTITEIGLGMAARPAPIVMFGPKALPKAIVKKLHDAFKMAMEDSEFHAAVKTFNMSVIYLNSEDCEKSAREDLEPIGKLVQKLGLQKK